MGDATMEGEVASITWFKDGRPIANGNEVNFVLASDNRTITVINAQRGTTTIWLK